MEPPLWTTANGRQQASTHRYRAQEGWARCRHTSQAAGVAPWIQKLIEEDTAKRIELGWYRKPEPDEILPFASPIVAAKQPSKGPDARRICVDYRAVNDCAEETRHPVKNQQDVLRRLKGKKRFGVVDLRKGYHQVKLTRRASVILAVITHGLDNASRLYR